MGGFFSKSVVFYEHLPTEEKLTIHAVIRQNIDEIYSKNPYEIIWKITTLHAQERTILFNHGSRGIVFKLSDVVDIISECVRRPFTVSFIPPETVAGKSTNERVRINFLQGVPLPLAPVSAVPAT